jgi:hypothetical protein
VQKRAAERNPELRDAWIKTVAKYKASQLLFLDESAANERTGDRKYGWAPVGKTPFEYTPFKRSERWSILPVYSSEGFLAWDIIQGSWKKDSFIEFVRTKVIPLCTAYPGPRSVLVMDNAPIHHCAVRMPYPLLHIIDTDF